MGGNPVTRVRFSFAIVTAVAVAVSAWACFVSTASASAESPSITVKPKGQMSPSFGRKIHDYAVRCQPGATTLRVHGAKGWRIRVDQEQFQRRDIVRKLHARPGAATDVSFRRANGKKRRNYQLRCLPGDFPEYTFERDAPGGPKLFSIQLGLHYGAIFDRNGVPVWWYQASGEPDNIQILPDGTVAFDPVDELSFQTGDYEIRTLKGRLLRVVRGSEGAAADIHEIQLLPNGNYLIGAQVEYPADTSAYGGSADSMVTGIEIQELTPEGELVRKWESRGNIGLEETGRWWDNPILDNQPYDVVHWNSAELVGKRRLFLSFRHLDAVYEVDFRTGDVVWKLGGTETPQSLEVVNDPNGDYPLGGQHDARLEPDGSVTIYDNRTGLVEPPRSVRYRINEDAGTARLVQSITDPEIPNSFCCGSARLLDSSDWLIGWGGQGLIGGYERDGDRLFALKLAVGFSYRANPVPEGVVTTRQLRSAMDVMAKRR